MRWESYICYAGTEVANHARVATYVSNALPEATMPLTCACAVLDEGYESVSLDPAPWYESTRSDSADFLGFYAANISLLSPNSRESNESGRNGSALGPLRRKGRIVEVSGISNASSPRGQEYGERWLDAVLRGGSCVGEGCPTSDLVLLRGCEEGYETDADFRTLVNVGLMDGPVAVQLEDLPECKAQQVSFILQSTMPYLYHPTTRCLDGVSLASTYGDPLDCSLTTPEWMGEGTFVIDITSTDTSDVEDIVISGRISPEGCPATGDARSIPPAFTYRIPVLAPEDRIVIDGMRRQVRYYDASRKTTSPGLPFIDWEGPWEWPDNAQCGTSMCLEIEALVGDASVTVDSVLREV